VRLRPWTRGLYINNLGDEAADRVAEAYGANYSRLTAIKAIYDPGNFFRGNHNIPPHPDRFLTFP
jgi:hypothetical protein